MPAKTPGTALSLLREAYAAAGRQMKDALGALIAEICIDELVRAEKEIDKQTDTPPTDIVDFGDATLNALVGHVNRGYLCADAWAAYGKWCDSYNALTNAEKAEIEDKTRKPMKVSGEV